MRSLLIATTVLALSEGNSGAPQFMSQVQHEKVLAASKAAQILSIDATPNLLASFDDPLFRTILQESTEREVGFASPSQLLEMLREACRVAEFVHGFPASLIPPFAYSPSLDMDLLANATFLPCSGEGPTYIPTWALSFHLQWLLPCCNRFTNT
jgi:hypothetical protein